MRNLLIAVTCLSLTINSYSQEKHNLAYDDSIYMDNYEKNFVKNNVKEYIYNQVYKNIAAFNIRYASYWYNGLVFTDRFRGKEECFYDILMPDYGYKLKMDIERLDSIYPNPKFHLYKIFLPRFDFIEDPNKRDLPEITSVAPRIMEHFLIVLNENNGDIKFVSGQFFRSYISDDFHINQEDMATFIPYLTLRAFDVGGSNIKFKGKKHKKWIFEGYSEIYKKSLTITVDRKDIDHTQTNVNVK